MTTVHWTLSTSILHTGCTRTYPLATVSELSHNYTLIHNFIERWLLGSFKLFCCECCSHCKFQPYDCYIYALWSRFSPPSNYVNGHVLQVSTTWALTCPEMVHRRPCTTREIEIWLSDSKVGNNSVVDHRSRRPVRSSLRNCVDRCCLTIFGVKMQAMEVDAQIHQHTQANLDGLQWFEA